MGAAFLGVFLCFFEGAGLFCLIASLFFFLSFLEGRPLLTTGVTICSEKQPYINSSINLSLL